MRAGGLYPRRGYRAADRVDAAGVTAQVTRRGLLRTLFDGLIVREGEIIEYVPRADRVGEVVSLIEQALGGAEVIVGPAPSVRRPDRPMTNGGKGGIRTLEGVSHPLPA